MRDWTKLCARVAHGVLFGSAVVAVCGGCSTSGSFPAGATGSGDGTASAGFDVAATDATGQSETVGGPRSDAITGDTTPAPDVAPDAAIGDATGDAGVADATGADADGPKDAAADGPDVDFDLLDPPDAGAEVAADTAAPPSKGLEVVFAHTSSQLYKLEKNAFALVGNFAFTKNAGQVTDIALDDDGNLFAVTFNDVFACDKAIAKCTWLASLPQSFNGLTFVPKDVVLPGKPALIGVANSGEWNLIEVNGNTAKVTKLGAYGGFTSSGDAFSVAKVGTYATVKAGVLAFSDKLVQVDPATGAVLKTVGDTGVSDLWGVAWSAGVLYGFASSGKVYALDIATGKASTVPGLLVPNGVSWWGAGVSTRAAL